MRHAFLSSTEEIIDEARNGRMFILIDDEGHVLTHTETWSADGRSGRFTTDIAGVPGKLAGTFEIAERPGGSVLRITGEVTVSVPLIGGKLAAAGADTAPRTRAREHAFTISWLAEQPE